MLPASVPQILELLDRARDDWNFEEEPEVGAYPFGDFILEVTRHELTKGEITKRFVVTIDDEVLTMLYGWHETETSKGFLYHMTSPREFEIAGLADTKEEKEMPPQSAIHDEETREKIRLKCKNDWDIDLTEDQVSMCIIEMEETGLSIFHNQLWPNSRKTKKRVERERGEYDTVDAVRITWDKTIDGYRAVASRTGMLAGIDAAEFKFEGSGDTEDLIASVTVYRTGPMGNKRYPFVGVARYSEFVQMVNEWKDNRKTGKKVPNHVWAEKPKNQLAVTAERQALRKAFQACDDDQQLPASIDGADPEPDLEQSRGQEVEHEDAYQTTAKGKESLEESKADKPKEEPKEEKPKGAYVGIPKDGFVPFAKYNKDERIVLVAKKEGRTILALDSGQRVTVSDDGLEVDRRDRTDENKGGRKWAAGDTYFDGAKVEKTAGSKKDPLSLRILLDSGFEVRLNRWGNEERRKKREAKPAADKPEAKKEEKKEEKKADKKAEPAESSKVEHDPNIGKDVVDTTATKPKEEVPPAEAKAPGDNENVDVDDIEDVAQLRKITTPLLKSYCDTVLKRRVSFKGAYTELTGVILSKGQSMAIDDYRVLYESLDDVLKEVNSGGRKAG